MKQWKPRLTMGVRRNKKSSNRPRSKVDWLGALRRPAVRRAAAITVGIGALAGLVVASTVALNRLSDHVGRSLLARSPDASVEFVDLPEPLVGLASGDLRGCIAESLERDWTDADRCREIAERLSSVGWIAHVKYVRRTPGGRFRISARYRLPVAMIADRHDYVLVDGEGVRLPGVYVYHPRWYIVDGVEAPAPPVGQRWSGDDVRAGLELLGLLQLQPFRTQIAGVDVGNLKGRRNARQAHLQLITDKPGGRIRWGSAPGYEVEENTVAQKLTLLRNNFESTGRVDAGFEVVDVSTLPDRFHIPG